MQHYFREAIVSMLYLMPSDHVDQLLTFFCRTRREASQPLSACTRVLDFDSFGSFLYFVKESLLAYELL